MQTMHVTFCRPHSVNKVLLPEATIPPLPEGLQTSPLLPALDTLAVAVSASEDTTLLRAVRAAAFADSGSNGNLFTTFMRDNLLLHPHASRPSRRVFTLADNITSMPILDNREYLLTISVSLREPSITFRTGLPSPTSPLMPST